MLFRAFADRTRLRILNLLQGGEVCTGDLVTVIGAPQPTISRHLAHLREAGLVQVHQERTWRFYSLAAPGNDLHERLVDCLGTCLAEVPQLRRDAKKLARLRAGGGCCAREAIAAETGTRAAPRRARKRRACR